MEILVFKTNVRYKKNVEQVRYLFDNCRGIRKWNIDLQDTDKVLRVEAEKISAAEIQDIMRYAGFDCEELN